MRGASTRRGPWVGSIAKSCCGAALLGFGGCPGCPRNSPGDVSSACSGNWAIPPKRARPVQRDRSSTPVVTPMSFHCGNPNPKSKSRAHAPFRAHLATRGPILHARASRTLARSLARAAPPSDPTPTPTPNHARTLYSRPHARITSRILVHSPTGAARPGRQVKIKTKSVLTSEYWEHFAASLQNPALH